MENKHTIHNWCIPILWNELIYKKKSHRCDTRRSRDQERRKYKERKWNIKIYRDTEWEEKGNHNVHNTNAGKFYTLVWVERVINKKNEREQVKLQKLKPAPERDIMLFGTLQVVNNMYHL